MAHGRGEYGRKARVQVLHELTEGQLALVHQEELIGPGVPWDNSAMAERASLAAKTYLKTITTRQ